ncbi:hypothetical protein VIGAN_11058800 [Vigna angularis var. angularis]|uniref:Uncharacterized protein n=1 Tax=Vigna angularis var. angularis TaxID=157739 RepID=A0A0S3T8M9_PHAAN|nr:hypothetical protein VIGAN_11058800 [Vigna angularis var. angularis]
MKGGCHDLCGRWQWLLRRRWWRDLLVASLIAGCAKERESSHGGYGGDLMELARCCGMIADGGGTARHNVVVDGAREAWFLVAVVAAASWFSGLVSISCRLTWITGVILENAMVAVTRWRRRLRVVACGDPIKVARLLGSGSM